MIIKFGWLVVCSTFILIRYFEIKEKGRMKLPCGMRFEMAAALAFWTKTVIDVWRVKHTHSEICKFLEEVKKN